jgi:Tfp pilus assembly protein PilO
MDQLRRFVWPVATGGSVLLIALIALMAWIVPEGHKVSAANANKIVLLDQETSLQNQITALAHESKQEPQDCSNLRQDLTLVPGTPTVDLFLHQISQLATNSGTVTPSVTITSSGTASAIASPSGAQTVGIALEVSGTYRQVLNFLNGLDNVHSLQRLYSVSSVTLAGGTASTSSPANAYTLQLQGDIYYSTSGQEDVCSTSKNNVSSSAF